MNSKKINVLFDATILINDLEKSASRSGIFITGYNVLLELAKKENLDIWLYSNKKTHHLIKLVLNKNPNLQGFKFLPLNNNIELMISKYNAKKLNLKNKKTKVFERTLVIIKLLIYSTIEKIAKIISGKKQIKQKEELLKQMDVFLSSMYIIPDEIMNYKNITKYTILYDTIPIIYNDVYPDIYKSFWYNKLINSINGEDKYFSISEQTTKDFIKYTPKINPDNIIQLPLAASNNFYCCTDNEILNKVKSKYNIPQNGKYVFSLCTLEPRKNLIFAINNFIEFIDKNNINDLYLVIGGGHWESFIDKFNNELANLNKFQNKILKIGYVDDEDLAALYSDAFCFVYPSLYEGFGLPPLEAMQCGCPVITSNNSSIPEVVDDAAITIDPTSNEQMVSAYEKLYKNKELRKTLSIKGLERAKLFSWEKSADIIEKEFKKQHALKKAIISNKTSAPPPNAAT